MTIKSTVTFFFSSSLNSLQCSDTHERQSKCKRTPTPALQLLRSVERQGIQISNLFSKYCLEAHHHVPKATVFRFSDLIFCLVGTCLHLRRNAVLVSQFITVGARWIRKHICCCNCFLKYVHCNPSTPTDEELLPHVFHTIKNQHSNFIQVIKTKNRTESLFYRDRTF